MVAKAWAASKGGKSMDYVGSVSSPVLSKGFIWRLSAFVFRENLGRKSGWILFASFSPKWDINLFLPVLESGIYNILCWMLMSFDIAYLVSFLLMSETIHVKYFCLCLPVCVFLNWCLSLHCLPWFCWKQQFPGLLGRDILNAKPCVSFPQEQHATKHQHPKLSLHLPKDPQLEGGQEDKLSGSTGQSELGGAGAGLLPGLCQAGPWPLCPQQPTPGPVPGQLPQPCYQCHHHQQRHRWGRHGTDTLAERVSTALGFVKLGLNTAVLERLMGLSL